MGESTSGIFPTFRNFPSLTSPKSHGSMSSLMILLKGFVWNFLPLLLAGRGHYSMALRHLIFPPSKPQVSERTARVHFPFGAFKILIYQPKASSPLVGLRWETAQV